MEQYKANIGSAQNNYHLTAKQEPEPGLYYFYARWYDPQVGMFITKDSLVKEKTRYTYCANKPIRFIDPEGKQYYIAIPYIGGGFISRMPGFWNDWSCFENSWNAAERTFTHGPKGHKKHCYVCCRLTACFGINPIWTSFGNYIWELLGGWDPEDSWPDIKSCIRVSLSASLFAPQCCKQKREHEQ